MQAEITSTMFVDYVGTTFDVCDDPSNVFPITLTSVVENPKSRLSESFSLFFRGPLQVFLPQGLYQLKHADLGDLNIFLVPIAQGVDGFEYQAVFNRMIQ